MRLDEILDGRVYVDTNILYMYLRADASNLSTIRLFLDRVVQGEIEAVVGIPVLDELVYRLLLARLRDESKRNPLDTLRSDVTGAIERHGELVCSATRRLMALPNVSLVPVEQSDGDRMLDNIVAYKLLPRDALHMAIMQRLRIEVVASDDTDFDRVAGVERLWLVNPPT